MKTANAAGFGPGLRSRAALVSPLILLVTLGAVLVSCQAKTAAPKKSLDPPSVSVFSPRYGQVAPSFSLIGTVKARNEVTVVSETSGRIVAMPASIGALVTAETPLVQVDSDLRQAALLAADAAYQKAVKDADRASTLQAVGMVADASKEAAQVGQTAARAQYLIAKKEYENTTIRSPIAGTIADTFVTKGGEIGPGTPVALVVDTSRLKVRVLLPETTALRQKKGDKVTVSSDLLPGKSFAGAIESISVRGDESHAFPTDVSLLGDAARALRAGMSVRLDFAQAPRRALLIPRNAILGSVRSPQVFVLQDSPAAPEDPIALLKTIVVGDEFGTDIEVLSGLTERDRVVIGGQSLVSDGQSVRVAVAEAAK